MSASLTRVIVDLLFLLAFSVFWMIGQMNLLRFITVPEIDIVVLMAAYFGILFFVYPFCQQSGSLGAWRRYPLQFGRVMLTFIFSHAIGLLVEWWLHPDLDWSLVAWTGLFQFSLAGAVCFVFGSLIHARFSRRSNN